MNGNIWGKQCKHGGKKFFSLRPVVTVEGCLRLYGREGKQQKDCSLDSLLQRAGVQHWHNYILLNLRWSSLLKVFWEKKTNKTKLAEESEETSWGMRPWEQPYGWKMALSWGFWWPELDIAALPLKEKRLSHMMAKWHLPSDGFYDLRDRLSPLVKVGTRD